MSIGRLSARRLESTMSAVVPQAACAKVIRKLRPPFGAHDRKLCALFILCKGQLNRQRSDQPHSKFTRQGCSFSYSRVSTGRRHSCGFTPTIQRAPHSCMHPRMTNHPVTGNLSRTVQYLVTIAETRWMQLRARRALLLSHPPTPYRRH